MEKRKTATSAAVKKKYNDKTYDRIEINSIPKGKKEVIRDMAESKGMSVNAYIIDLIKKDFEKNQKIF